MKVLSLRDQHFSHSKNGYSGDFYPAKNIVWCREFPYKTDITVFTGNSVHDVQNMRNHKNIAWIVEPYEISPYSYNILIPNHNCFDLILSHDKEFLSRIPNGEFITYGDCWIPEKLCTLFPKSDDKLISIICSEKKITQQQILRHKCLTLSGIDKFGKAVDNPIESKLEALWNYQFHIVVENSKRDDFFTEKIMDCFATGTIPIYCGTKNIGEYFDTNGFLRFSSVEELSYIIDCIKTKNIKYEDFWEGIVNNFRLFKKYIIKDDIVLQKLEERRLI